MHVRCGWSMSPCVGPRSPLSGLPTDHVVILDLCDPEKVKPRDLPLTLGEPSFSQNCSCGCYAFGITLEKGILYPYLCACVIDLSVSWIYSFRFLDARLAREDSVNDWGELTSPCGADLGGAARPSALIRNSQQPGHPRLRHLRLVFWLLRRHPRSRARL